MTGCTARVLNIRTARRGPDDVYIGRPSIWGNRFVIGRDGTREEVIRKYDDWLDTQPHLLARLPVRRPESPA